MIHKQTNGDVTQSLKIHGNIMGNTRESPELETEPEEPHTTEAENVNAVENKNYAP